MLEWIAGKLSPDLAEAKQKLEQLQAEVSVDNDLIKSLRFKVSTTSLQNKILHQKLSEAAVREQQCHKKINALNEASQRNMECVAHLNCVLNETKSNLASVKSTLNVMTQDRNQLAETNAVLSSQIASLQREKTNLEMRIAAKNHELEIAAKIERGNLDAIKELNKTVRILEKKVDALLSENEN